MGKIKLTPTEINRIIKDYLQLALDQTDLTYRKGWFYLRPPGYSRKVPGIPYRAHQIKAMTVLRRTSCTDNGDGSPY
jgi:hypothetical protein